MFDHKHVYVSLLKHKCLKVKHETLQLGLVNLTIALVDMCLTNVLVVKIGYLFNQFDWLKT